MERWKWVCRKLGVPIGEGGAKKGKMGKSRRRSDKTPSKDERG